MSPQGVSPVQKLRQHLMDGGVNQLVGDEPDDDGGQLMGSGQQPIMDSDGCSVAAAMATRSGHEFIPTHIRREEWEPARGVFGAWPAPSSPRPTVAAPEAE